ncbi:agouti-related protein [Hippocampus zosterae]|uniref:agouti-related protein n=1 Tax=Hippocampus zosterae TaxID=109293 RepID=UPI00223DF6DF|nr:agouti-related protein [Hippocampus zosterae]
MTKKICDTSPRRPRKTGARVRSRSQLFRMWVGVAPSRRCWFLCLLAVSSATLLRPRQLRHLQLDADWSPLDRSHAPEAWHEPAQVDEDNNEERGDFLMEAESYDQDGSASRAMRSTRRCIRHQQSCLGFPLPCCDACDTCYCRFFNAICYCRRVGHSCPSART